MLFRSLLDDQKFADQYYNYQSGKIANLYGFEVYEYTATPYYTVSSKAKKAWGSVPAATDNQASVAFSVERAMRADGDTKVYLSDAKNDPQYQRRLYSLKHYSICLPLKKDAQGAIVSGIAG